MFNPHANERPDEGDLFHQRRGRVETPSRPFVSEDDVDLLIAKLTGRRWVVKHELMTLLGWNERRIQEAREDSDGRVISSSKRGYCLLTEATLGEVNDVLGEITRRLRTIGKGYSAIARRKHQSGVTV